MKYVFIAIFMALVFGVLFLLDKLITALMRFAKERSQVKPPVRYPVGAVLLVLLAVGVGIYAARVKSILFAAAAVTFLGIAIWAWIYYKNTSITYNEETFCFHSGSVKKTFSFAHIDGQRVDVTRKTKCLVLCIGQDDVVLYSNMQGYEPFLRQGYLSWCKAKGLDPEAQSWHDPKQSQWFPDQQEENEKEE